MGNILKDNSGNVIISGNKAFEVTASVDSNIVPGNIKKDVSILGVTGTYEGSGGGSGELPYDHKVQFIRFTGTQWIETNTQIHATTTIELDVTAEEHLTFGNTCAGRPSGSGYMCFPFGCTNDASKMRSIYAKDSSAIQFDYSFGTRIKILYNESKKLYVNDILKGTFTDTRVEPQVTQYLFIGNTSTSTEVKSKFYGIKVWDDTTSGTLLANYIPVRVGSIGYLYDEVSKTLLGNSGTGVIDIGGDIDGSGIDNLPAFITNSLTRLEIPSGMTTVRSYLCLNQSALVEIVIPNTVTSIGSGAFQGCTNLVNINIPSAVTTFGQGAFYLCEKITSVVIPEGVTVIPHQCFDNCTSLASVTLPSTLTQISTYSFRSCAFKNITIPSGVTRIDGNAFVSCRQLESITIPEGCTIIDANAFNSCVKLQSISLPSTLTTLNNNAFNTCSVLERLVFPPLLTIIRSQLCWACLALEYIDLGANITSIEGNAFSGCKAVKTIVCRATTPPTVQSSSFGSSTGNYTGRNTYDQGVNKLYVPQGCSSAYNTSYWASVLLDSTKCGFTIAELDANGNIPT